MMNGLTHKAPRELLRGAGYRFKPSHISMPLDEANVKELEGSGETVVITSLRHNHPLLVGVRYGSGSFATIVHKRLVSGRFCYVLRSERWNNPKKC